MGYRNRNSLGIEFEEIAVFHEFWERMMGALVVGIVVFGIILVIFGCMGWTILGMPCLPVGLVLIAGAWILGWLGMRNRY